MLTGFSERILANKFLESRGVVCDVRADALTVSVPGAKVGSICEVQTEFQLVPVEIIALSREGHVALPLGDLEGVQLGDQVVMREDRASIPIGKELLGSVIDSMGESYFPERDQTPIGKISLRGEKLNPLSREIISLPLDLGVRSINACLTCGKGQRQGIFAGSGVGKSVLLGMLARNTEADVVVIGLIGERGREVREFLERDLGEEGRKKSVVVVETSDKSAIRRVRGAFAATAIAEHYRKQGAHVLLLMDSLTRFAMAQREIGIAAKEPPTTKGYTPSVFQLLAQLVERAGYWGENGGSITGLYTVLVEGDDLEDPVSDSVRSLLDGHIVLSRKLANRGHYPAVDILSSVSRTMDQVIPEDHRLSARKLKETLSRYLDNEDAIHFGMYQRGSDPRIDESIDLEPKIVDFLRQSRDEKVSISDSQEQLLSLFKE